MSVNLQKGQKVDLTKGNAGLKRLVVGLGWDEAEPKRGFFGIKKKNDITKGNIKPKETKKEKCS